MRLNGGLSYKANPELLLKCDVLSGAQVGAAFC